VALIFVSFALHQRP